MPTIAPRFNPEGVRVGSMPVPDVKPAMGTANALASIGDTIANLGQTVDRVQDNQARRAAVEEHKANIRKATDKAAASDQIQRYKIKLDEERTRFQTDANRANIPKAMESFDAFLASGHESFVKDLTPEQLAIFQQDKSLLDYAAQADVRGVAHGRMKQWNLETAKTDYESATTNAAYARATGKDGLAAVHIAQAHARAKDAANLTGAEYNPSATEEKVEIQALEELIKSRAPHTAVDFYKKGNFGRLQSEADSIIRPQMDAAWAKTQSDAMKHPDGKYRLKVGETPDVDKMDSQGPVVYKPITVFDANAAIQSVDEMDVSPERKELLKKNIAIEAEAQNAQLKAIGEGAARELDTVQLLGDSATKSWLESNETKAKLDLMPLENKNAIYDRYRRGPAHSNPEHSAYLKHLLQVGDKRALAAVTRGSLSVTNAEWEAFDKERQTSDDPLVKKINQYVNERWEDGGRKAIPSPTRDKPLSPDEQITINRIDATRRYVANLLETSPGWKEERNKDPNAIYRQMEAAYKDATKPKEVTVDGEKIMTTVAEENTLGLPFTVTDDLMIRAGVGDMREPLARTKVIQQYKMEQQAAIDKEMEAERRKRFAADRRPQTDAEMQANRERIGAAWRRGSRYGVAAQSAEGAASQPATFPDWQPMTREQEDADRKAREAKPFAPVTGPNTNYRDF